jgi:hypothetical protein
MEEKMDSKREARNRRRRRRLTVSGEIRVPQEVLSWEVELLAAISPALSGDADEQVAKRREKELHHGHG